MSVSKFEKGVIDAMKELTAAHSDVTGEGFANTAILTYLIKMLMDKDPSLAPALEKVFEGAVAEATNASMTLGIESSTHAIRIIDIAKDAVLGRAQPKQDV